jgi:hypothetical protein
MASLPKSKLGLDRTLKGDMKNIPDGEQGNLATISIMSSVARKKSTDPLVRQLAIKILNESDTKSHNHLDEAIAIGEWVKNNIRYMKDPHGTELLQDPILMIEKCEKGECRGDCDDMSLLVATLLISIGIQPFFKIVRWTKKDGNYNHIYIVVKEGNYKEPKREFVIDPIIKDRPIGFENKPFASFNLIKV